MCLSFQHLDEGNCQLLADGHWAELPLLYSLPGSALREENSYGSPGPLQDLSF